MIVKVAKVIDEYTLVLTVGSQDGIRPGQRFLIYSIGAEVTDPDSGESLGALEVIRGTAKATHVQEKICTVTSDMKAIDGPTVRTTTKEPFSYRATQVTEEIPPSRQAPFTAPSIGDFAKPI